MSTAALRFNQMPEVILLPNTWVQVYKDHVEAVEPDIPLSFRQRWDWNWGYGPWGFHTLSRYIDQTAYEFMQFQIFSQLKNIEKIKSGRILELNKKEFELLIETMHTLDRVKLNTAALKKKILQDHFHSAKWWKKCLLALTIAFEKIKALYLKLRYGESRTLIPYFSSLSLENMRANAIEARHQMYELNSHFKKPHLLWKGHSQKNTYHLTLTFSRVSQQLKLYKNHQFQGQVVFSKMNKTAADEQTLLIFYSAVIKNPETGHLFATFFNKLLTQEVAEDHRKFPDVPDLLLMGKPPQMVREDISYQDLSELHKKILQDSELFPDMIPIPELIKAAKGIS